MFRTTIHTSVSIKMLSTALLGTAALLTACAKSSDGGGDAGPQKSFRFELECSGGQAFLQKIDVPTGLPSERGTVTLPGGLDCDDAADQDEAAIRRFPRSGDWTFYYKGTKTPLRKGRYIAGKREGEWRGFDKKGQLERRFNYQNGQKSGQETIFFAGTTNWRERGSNVAGKRDGVWETKHAKDGKCISKGAFSNGDKTGPWEECSQDPKTREWYPNFAGAYLDGLRHGPAKITGAKGNLIASGSYHADTSDACRKQPPGGRLATCGTRDGAWQIFFPNGNLAMKGSYDRATGNRVGTWNEYYQSGERMAVGPRDHTRRGRWKFYAKNGSTLFEGDFNGNDFSPRYAVIYENGRKTAEGDLSIGLIKYDVPGDTIKISKLIKNGQWKLYKNGRVVGEGEMVAGKKNGQWKEGGKTNCYMLGRERACQ